MADHRHRDALGLKRPIFAATAYHGHFGRDGFPWEETNRTAELKAAVEARQLGQYTLAQKIGEGGMGGVWLAEHLHQRLEITEPLGTLDISFYRDDFTRIGMNPEVHPSDLPAPVDVVIAAVAEEGMPAALLMSNLQASLQGQVIHPATVAEIIARMNELLELPLEERIKAAYGAPTPA